MQDSNRCLSCHGSGAYARSNIDLVNYKNTKQKKTNNKNPNKNSATAKVSGEGFIVKNICCVLLPAS